MGFLLDFIIFQLLNKSFHTQVYMLLYNTTALYYFRLVVLRRW